MKNAHFSASMAALVFCWSLLVPLASVAGPREELEKRSKPFTPKAFVYDSARNGDLEAVKLFLAAGMDVDAIFDVGYTALIFAARGGHLGIVKFLAAQGADVNHAPEFGDTALKWAAKKGASRDRPAADRKGGRHQRFLGGYGPNECSG